MKLLTDLSKIVIKELRRTTECSVLSLVLLLIKINQEHDKSFATSKKIGEEEF